MTPLQREALQMCLEYIETDAHERRHVRWKINEALAQPQQEPSGWQKIECPICGDMAIATDIPAAQPQQEPVAWALYQRNLLLSFWMDKGDAYDFEFTSEHRWEPLYTSPPAQEFTCSTGLCHYRKPLTDEQIRRLLDDSDEGQESAELILGFARAIEAAHNIKENT